MYKLTRTEQETTIVWDAENRIAKIYTCDPVTMRKLDKLSAAYPDEYRCIWQDDKYPAKRYTVSSKYIRFGKPASEAQKAAAKINSAARNLSNSQGLSN